MGGGNHHFSWSGFTILDEQKNKIINKSVTDLVVVYKNIGIKYNRFFRENGRFHVLFLINVRKIKGSKLVCFFFVQLKTFSMQMIIVKTSGCCRNHPGGSHSCYFYGI